MPTQICVSATRRSFTNHKEEEDEQFDLLHPDRDLIPLVLIGAGLDAKKP